MVVLRRAMLGAGAQCDPVLPSYRGTTTQKRSSSARAHYLISRTACSKPTKRLSKRPATLGVAFSPSPPPSPQSATAAGRTSVRNEGRWYNRHGVGPPKLPPPSGSPAAEGKKA